MGAGTQPKPVTGYPSKDIELVGKITDKTRANKILWKKSETGFSASVSGELEMGFVRARSLLQIAGWSLFTVRDKRGNEILRVDNPNIDPLVPLLAGPGEHLRQAVSGLYNAVEESALEEINKAIQLIDRV